MSPENKAGMQAMAMIAASLTMMFLIAGGWRWLHRMMGG
jgi:hypothetical protein